MEDSFLSLLKGFLTGGGLIVAIGAQNAFVLKQGLLKSHVFLTAIFCSVIDSTMIGLGVGGLGSILTSSLVLLMMAKWGGAAFLFYYGYRSFRSVFRSQSLQVQMAGDPARPSIKETVVTLSVVSLLNPHVYLDTVLLLGSIGAQFSPFGRLFFALGAMISSFMWFFGLCYGARLMTPLFENQKSWKVLDFITGSTMWAIALSLVFSNAASPA